MVDAAVANPNLNQNGNLQVVGCSGVATISNNNGDSFRFKYNYMTRPQNNAPILYNSNLEIYNDLQVPIINDSPILSKVYCGNPRPTPNTFQCEEVELVNHYTNNTIDFIFQKKNTTTFDDLYNNPHLTVTSSNITVILA